MHASIATAILLATTFAAAAQAAPSPDVLKDLAPTGKLRAAINFGNGVLAQKGPNGEARGVSVDLAHALGKKLGVPVELITVQAAGKSFEALASGAADVGFIAIEPARAAELDFTPPYVLIEGTYLVRQDSPLQRIEDVDKPGIKIAVGLASAYDLYLTRTIKHAELVRAQTGGAGGLALFREQQIDVAAGVREALEAYAKEHADVRVMSGHFQEIQQAMGTAKGRAAGLAYLRGFIEEMKAYGFVATALKNSGQTAPVAPPAK
jgi:polar amino acid transport system substrate-binding protein